MSYNVYLVEDEENLNQVLKSYLLNEGWNTKTFATGKEALSCIDENPDLWILDIMLPDTDGFDLIKQIKNHNEDIPVIFISARDAELDRVIGLEMGGDDYIAKPFLPRELIIRIKNLLKKTYEVNNKRIENNSFTLSTYTIDIGKRKVLDGDIDLELSSKEFDMLILFANNLDRAFSRKQILTSLWGDDYFGSDRVVDDLLRRLRKKLPNVKIETIYGYGYRMVD